VVAADGGPAGLITAHADGGVVFWPEAELRAAAEAAGVTTLPAGASPEQWPLLRLDAAGAADAARALLHRAAAPPPPAPAAPPTIFPPDAHRWLIDYASIALTRAVGEGAFGKVWLGRWQETDVAVKQLASLGALGLPPAGAGSEAEAMKTLEREVSLMVSMRHPNVILFMGVCPDPPAVVTEYCSRGSLYDLLRAARGAPALARQLDWPRRLGVALDAAKGMLYLHSHKPPIVHRDLKSPNLLVDRHWRCKVRGGGLSGGVWVIVVCGVGGGMRCDVGWWGVMWGGGWGGVGLPSPRARGCPRSPPLPPTKPQP
jgi:hypothetical protein